MRWVVVAGVAAVAIAASGASAAALASSDARLTFVVPDQGIVSINSDGTGRRLVVRGEVNSGAFWSPDGRSYLYLSDRHVPRSAWCRERNGDCPTGIYVGTTNGSSDRLLTPATAESHSPGWSPDGRQLLYLSAGKLWLIKPDGRGRRPVSVDRSVIRRPAWLPDGHSIVFESLEGIMVADMAAESRPSRLLVKGREPLVSPDGTAVAYWDLTFGLSVFELATGTKRQVVPEHNLYYNFRVAWAPDSTRLAYAGTIPAKPPAVGSDVALFLVDRTGKRRRQLTAGVDADMAGVAWGHTTIFYSVAGRGVWSISHDGSSRTKIASRGTQIAIQPGA